MSAQALALRRRIVLACVDGLSNTQVGSDLGVHPTTVATWRKRFAANRLEGLADEKRPGFAGSVTDEQVKDVIVWTRKTQKGASHWSTRKMSKQSGLSQWTIMRICRAFSSSRHRSTLSS
ncbi:helix-turn-helix domain-containing protein [Streptomyces sp. NPDC005303]|uniref:helix-turn-helix domain-containing protein n=1 Tax=Streptomyces sp. NPDC005303 TaxID=3155713 RepID=UPI00339F2BFE